MRALRRQAPPGAAAPLRPAAQAAEWDYHVVRCAGCGFLFRHPGIRPERLGDLYSSGKYAKFLAGKYNTSGCAATG